jgi:hypothetical protein
LPQSKRRGLEAVIEEFIQDHWTELHATLRTVGLPEGVPPSPNLVSKLREKKPEAPWIPPVKRERGKGCRLTSSSGWPLRAVTQKRRYPSGWLHTRRLESCTRLKLAAFFRR